MYSFAEDWFEDVGHPFSFRSCWDSRCCQDRPRDSPFSFLLKSELNLPQASKDCGWWTGSSSWGRKAPGTQRQERRYKASILISEMHWVGPADCLCTGYALVNAISVPFNSWSMWGLPWKCDTLPAWLNSQDDQCQRGRVKVRHCQTVWEILHALIIALVSEQGLFTAVQKLTVAWFRLCCEWIQSAQKPVPLLA